MSDEGKRTTMTITFGIRGPSWRFIGGFFVIGIVVLVMLWALIDVVMPWFGFDGKFGPGCDKGNPNCHVHERPLATQGDPDAG